MTNRVDSPEVKQLIKSQPRLADTTLMIQSHSNVLEPTNFKTPQHSAREPASRGGDDGQADLFDSASQHEESG